MNRPHAFKARNKDNGASLRPRRAPKPTPAKAIVRPRIGQAPARGFYFWPPSSSQLSKRRSRSGRRSIIARARSWRLACIRSRNGVAICTSVPCLKAISSVASLSSGCCSRTELIFSRSRAFLRRNSSFLMASGVSGSAGAGVVPATLSGVTEGSEGGCNSELGFCGNVGEIWRQSWRSNGRRFGVGSSLVVGFGHGVCPQEVRLTRVESVCSELWEPLTDGAR